MDYKALSQLASQMHKEVGAATIAFDLTNASAAGRELLPSPIPELRVEGRDLGPRKLRTWLWENRKEVAALEGEPFVWSVFQESDQSTHVGIGLLGDRIEVGAEDAQEPKASTNTDLGLSDENSESTGP